MLFLKYFVCFACLVSIFPVFNYVVDAQIKGWIKRLIIFVGLPAVLAFVCWLVSL